MELALRQRGGFVLAFLLMLLIAPGCQRVAPAGVAPQFPDFWVLLAKGDTMEFQATYDFRVLNRDREVQKAQIMIFSKPPNLRGDTEELIGGKRIMDSIIQLENKSYVCDYKTGSPTCTMLPFSGRVTTPKMVARLLLGSGRQEDITLENKAVRQILGMTVYCYGLQEKGDPLTRRAEYCLSSDGIILSSTRWSINGVLEFVEVAINYTASVNDGDFLPLDDVQNTP